VTSHIEWLEGVFAREDFLHANVPSCPKCDTRQVQLTSKAEPAHWKCRECKFEWRQEPRQF